MEKEKEEQIEDLVVVGIGASAGGLEALQLFVKNLPEFIQVAYVIAQHMDPTHDSLMVKLLARDTAKEVVEVESGTKPVANTIYITPPNNDVFIKDGTLQLKRPSSGIGPKPSIDLFFISLAEEKKERAVGIILSGTGSDGMHGVKAIRAGGGITIAQEPTSAKYNGMPLAAIHTGSIDLILHPENMGGELLELMQDPRGLSLMKEMQSSPDSIETILRLVLSQEGVDFSGYKKNTIERRIRRRMTALKIGAIEAYVEHCEKHREELSSLLKDILIGVTSFFRDPESFHAVQKFIKEIIESKQLGHNIRFWAPACATGEEAYSLAIVLLEELGAKAHDFSIQIFATDIDMDALAFARKARYPEASIQNLDQRLLRKYFTQKGNEFELNKVVRERVIFSRHDLIKDPPFLRLDLISCRNLLIYFNSELQNRVVPLFHYSLSPGGILFLGKSETIGKHADIFTVIDKKSKIYKSRNHVRSNAWRFPAFDQTIRHRKHLHGKESSRERNLEERVRDAISDLFLSNCVVINDNMDVIFVRGDVNPFVKLSPGAVNLNIFKMIHPDLSIETRSAIYNCRNSDKPVRSELLEMRQENGQKRVVRITTSKVESPGDDANTILIAFVDETGVAFPGSNVEISDDDRKDPVVNHLEMELAGTKEHLQTVIEELETSNEELQSLNEEMQSSNEELQSSNEELETTNEELQSTNEELQTAYAELKELYEDKEKQRKLLEDRTAELERSRADLIRKNEELDRARTEIEKERSFLSSIYEASEALILVLDQQSNFIELNKAAKSFFSESGVDFRDRKAESRLTYYLPEEDTIPFLNTLEMVEKERKSSQLELHIIKGFDYRYINWTVSLLNQSKNIQDRFLMIGIDNTEKQKAESLSRKLLSVVADTADIVMITDFRGIVEYVNPAFTEITGYHQSEILGRTPALLKSGQISDSVYSRMWETLLAGDSFSALFPNRKKNGEIYYEEKTINPIRGKSGDVTHFVSTGRDISDRLEARSFIEKHAILERALNKERHLRAIMGTITRISETILKSDSFTSIIQETCRILTEHGNYRMVWFGRIHQNRIEDFYSWPEEVQLIDDQRYIDGNQKDKDPVSRAFYDRHIIVTEDMSAIPHEFQKVQIPSTIQLSSMVSIPLFEAGEESPFGILCTYSDLKGGAEAEEISMLEELGGNIGFAFHAYSQENELSRQEQIMIQQSKMAAMGEMISAIAHQWRQPLNTVSVILQNMEDLFRENELSTSEMKSMVESGMRHIQLMSGTIDDFRNFFRPSKEMEAFNLARSINEVIGLIQEQFINHKIRIEIHENAQTSLEVNGYPNEFKHAVMNIINNAKDAILERRKDRNEDYEGIILIDLRSDQTRISINLRDNGGGIREEIMNRIFEPYYTTRKDGTGIGLYMTRMIIEKNMRGKLSVENAEEGASFTIEFDHRETQKGEPQIQ